ncbi:MAG: restriction endonuclease subunit S [Ignavibacteriaceae bacterium]|jgi:type I restriction enzyme S subunit|nr:restriction endonuclease subunit S [Ignavibacteriaceae bacterium]
MSEWKEYKLSDLMEIIGGGTPKTSVSEYWNGDIPWLSVSDFNNSKKYIYDAEKKITEKGLKESSTKILKKGQIIISARGTVGVIAMIGRDMAFNQTSYGLDSNKNLTDNEYLYYLLKYNIPNFISSSYGAVFDTITKETFNQIIVSIPEPSEQRAIASILSSLDDKIDLLHRQNKTLEALAETLFRQWFVEEADWNGKLSEYIKVQGGFAFKSQNFKEFGYARVLKITNISMGSIDIRNTQFVDEDIVRNIEEDKFRARTGDFLIAMTGAEIGKIGIVEKTNEQIWVNQRVGKLAKKVPYGNLIGYFALKSREGQEHIINTCSGSAQENISAAGIEEMEFAPYSKERANKFGIEIKPLFEKIIYNKNQIRTLTQLRDTLLPKLMSGEVRVKISESGFSGLKD